MWNFPDGHDSLYHACIGMLSWCKDSDLHWNIQRKIQQLRQKYRFTPLNRCKKDRHDSSRKLSTKTARSAEGETILIYGMIHLPVFKPKSVIRFRPRLLFISCRSHFCVEGITAMAKNLRQQDAERNSEQGTEIWEMSLVFVVFGLMTDWD